MGQPCEFQVAAAAPGSAPFLGELARFAGGGRSFTTAVRGGGQYACEAFYQESSFKSYHMLGGAGGDGRV